MISNIKTLVNAYVATNLITTILLGNDWINSNHVHLFGDQKRLTIPDQYGHPSFIPYIEPTAINYAALLVNQITLPPYSQTLVDVTCQIEHGQNLLLEPYGNHISKFIFMPYSLVDIKENETKVLLINAQDRQQTLSKHTRIGTFCRDATVSIFTTNSLEIDEQIISHLGKSRTRTAHSVKDNSNQHQTNTY